MKEDFYVTFSDATVDEIVGKAISILKKNQEEFFSGARIAYINYITPQDRLMDEIKKLEIKILRKHC